MSKLNVDLAMIRKYSVSGPRYTSYPPATCFTETVGWKEIAGDILENNGSDRPLSLYFHIPFCQSLCWYCGCTTIITTQESQSVRYVAYLEKEMTQMGAVLNPDRKVTQLHFGGGTPTFLPPTQIGRLGEIIRSRFKLADDIEASVEIDPRRLTQDHLTALREIGFNHVSLGVQDFNPTVQKAIHRIQSLAQTKVVVEWARALGFQSLNIDLMYGLPYQTIESFERTLDEALTLAPRRFAVFNYAHVPWLKPTQKILERALPSPAIKLQLLKLVIEKLTSAGYVYIGMDHFARPEDELAVAQRNKQLQRNFQGYSTQAGADIYAFGMSAISQTAKAYWQNHKDLNGYYPALDQGKSPLAKGYILTEEDRVRRETIMRLMCDLSLDFDIMSRNLGIAFTDYFAPELQSLSDLEADGLLVKTEHGLKVTDVGRLFLRNIAMRFDATLARNPIQQYSKTV